MIKTYIYGVPHGFDFYEKDAELNNYFKGFYISSRRGRRLMINRRNNGETIYSYLRYGLKEIDRQPLHSFFGMSLVVDNYQFCPNFKVLLEWFDYLFDKLVNEHNLIKKTEDGVLRYVVHKFDENPTDVEWLKSNLPNILTQAGQTEITNYDNSFVDGKAGLVVSFNDPVGENRLLETLKRYRWLSISSKILERQDITSGGPFEIELNFDELNGKLNEFNQQLLPIAVDISKGSYTDLKRMSDEIEEINTSLAKYFPKIDDLEEKEKFGGLVSKYVSLKGSIGTLLSKFSPSPEPQPNQETQYCFSCKQNKPLSHFRSPDATKCLECEKQDKWRFPEGNRTCISCGKKKSVRFFNQVGTDICDECAEKQTPNPDPGQEGFFHKLVNSLLSKWLLGALTSIAIVVGIAFAAINLPNRCSTQSVLGGGGERTDLPYKNVTVTGEKVDKKELDKLIASNDFKVVYEYVKDKNDAVDYKNLLKDSVKKYLMSIADEPQRKEEEVLVSIDNFYAYNIHFLDFINFGEKDKEYCKKFAKDYYYYWGLMNKQNITQEEKEEVDKILEKYPDFFGKQWMSQLPKVKVENANYVDTGNKSAQTEQTTIGSISVKYTTTSNKKENEVINENREIFVKKGTFVDFNYPGDIRFKKEVENNTTGKKEHRRIGPVKNQKVIFCDTIEITLTPK